MWTCERCEQEFLSSTALSTIRLEPDVWFVCPDCKEDFLSFMKQPEGDNGHE